MITILFCFIFIAKAEDSIEFKLRPEKEIYSQCGNCHRQKKYEYVPDKHKPVRAHQEIKLAHGNKEMSCNQCHDKNQNNFLSDMDKKIISFRESSPVCYQCHSDVFKSWKQNLHGKRTGTWNTKKVQFHCAECHNPHEVKFKEMKADPAPQKPKYKIKKEKH